MFLYVIGGAGLLLVLGAGAWIFVSSNVEQPAYVVISAEGDIERRSYPELVTASVVRTGSRKEAVRAGFRPLAGYIFAKEREGESISMTAPVTQRAGDGDVWTVRFIMPSEYDLNDLPDPATGDVTLDTLPATERAVIRFSGVATDELIATKQAALTEWISRQGLRVVGAPTYAYYNDPFTPGFLRRNEVLFDLAPAES